MEDLCNSDTLSILNAKVRNGGLLSPVESFNKFIDILPVLLAEEFVQNGVEKLAKPTVKGWEAIKYKLSYGNVYLHKASRIVCSQFQPRFPCDIVKDNDTYSAKLSVSVNIELTPMKYVNDELVDAGETVKTEIHNRIMGSIPIMVRSKLCSLHMMSPYEMIQCGEDPKDLGGYFIINGVKRSVISRSNTTKNRLKIIKTSDGQTIDSSYTSQPGDGFGPSKFLSISLNKEKFLLVRIILGKKLEFNVPFYIIFNAFDMLTDIDIIDEILPDYDEKNNKHVSMKQLMKRLFEEDYTELKTDSVAGQRFHDFKNGDMKVHGAACLVLANILNDLDISTSKVDYLMSTDKEKQITISAIQRLLDENIYPHLGTIRESRSAKLRFLGSNIRQTIGVSFGDPVTDRNSAETNVPHDTVSCMVQNTKTAFNISMVQKHKKALKNHIQTHPEDLNPIKSVVSQVKDDPLGMTFAKMLTKSGEHDIMKTTTITSRTSTQVRDGDGPAARFYQSNGITLDPDILENGPTMLEYRNIQPSFLGVKDLIHTVEGKKAGVNSQAAMGMKILYVTDSKSMGDIIYKDTNRIEGISDKPKFSLNGVPIGESDNIQKLVRKYRALRRHRSETHQSIDKISFQFKPMERGNTYAVSHAARPMVIFVIVYSVPLNEYEEKYSTWPFYPTDENGKEHTLKTLPDYDKSLIKKGHTQWTRFTKKHRDGLESGKLTLFDLQKEGIIEFLCPDEYNNMMVADCMETFLRNSKSKTNLYTHISIPWAMLSHATMTAPNGGMCQFIRLAYQGKFPKQACTEVATNICNSFPTKQSGCYNSYTCPAETIANKMLDPDGAPLNVAVMSVGENQEDSIVGSKRFAQLGICGLNLYSTHTCQLPSSGDHVFSAPKESTESLKCDSYDHLNENGLPVPGTILTKGMALIGMIEIVKSADDSNTTKTVDKSIPCSYNYPIIIDSISNENGNNASSSLTVKIMYHSVREVEEGDKFSSTNGGKAIVSSIRDDSELPIDENGNIPDLILNVAAFPSRMLLGQIISSLGALIALAHGKAYDASIFNDYPKEIMDSLAEEAGIDIDGLVKMYDGITGRRMRGYIFNGVTFFQRLEKMAKDNASFCNEATTNPRNKHKQKGISHGGGSRNGVMEVAIKQCQGAARTTRESLFTGCDGATLFVCNECNYVAAVGKINGTKSMRCVNKKCEGGLFSRIQNAYSTTAMIPRLMAFGTKVQLFPRELDFE